MLLIKTYLKEVSGKGIGLFASEKIPKNKIWHKDETEFDKVYTRLFVEANGLKDFFDIYATYNSVEETYYLCSDNARFVNHSYKPNTKYDKVAGNCIALVDIEIDEEITCDYREICDYNLLKGFDFNIVE